MIKTALITGASSGIGMELARVHAKHGGNLILVARRENKLNELKTELENTYKVHVHVYVKDLSETNSAQAIYKFTQQQNLQIDYLINNAGFGGLGYFHNRNWEEDEAMLRVNIIALSALTRLYLPSMIERNEGHILNIASSAGLMPGGPLQSIYFASKAFVISFTRSLAGELANTNVKATVLCPGATATEFEEKANLKDTMLFKLSVFSPQSVALDGYKAMLSGKLVKISAMDLATRFSFKLLPFLPTRTVLKMVKRLQEPKNKSI